MPPHGVIPCRDPKRRWNAVTLRALSGLAGKERKNHFRPFFSIFDHFLHFCGESEMVLPGDAAHDKTAARQDLFRAMDAGRSRDFRASIREPMPKARRRQRATRALLLLGTAHTWRIAAAAAKNFTIRKKRKSWSLVRDADYRVLSSMSRARTSRLPTWLAAVTTPSRSMRSTMRAARL